MGATGGIIITKSVTFGGRKLPAMPKRQRHGQR